MKSFLGSRRLRSYCAFCRSNVFHYRRKRLGLFHILLSLATAIFVSWALFGEMDPRSILFFIVGMVVSEVFIQYRWRVSVICRECGFDPILYKKDSQLAVEKVKAQLLIRESTGASFLRRRLELPKISLERAEVIEKMEKQRKLLRQNSVDQVSPPG